MTLSFKPYYGLDFFLFTASLSVCTILFGKMDWIILFMAVFMALPYMGWRHLRLSRPAKWIVSFFYIPFLISFCWSFILLVILNDPVYNEYLRTTFIFRSIHVFLFFILLIYSDQTIVYSSNYQSKKFLSVFAWGVIIILGIFGLWQILGNLVGIWVPNLETRGYLYSARALGISRVTSIADEPSYLAPFLIDAILILIFLGKKKLAIVLVLVLVFSLSFGGFSEILILLLAYLSFSSKKKLVKAISIIVGIYVFLLVFFPNIIELAIFIIQSRAELQEGFDPSQTSRTAMIIYPISKWSEFDIVSIFLGYGPGSSKYLLDANPNEALFTTSNNIFADLIYEEGIIGVLCFIILLTKMWVFFGTFKKSYSILSRLFLIHIILSSLYRADYSGTRYTALFIIILIFCQLFQPSSRLLFNTIKLNDHNNHSHI